MTREQALAELGVPGHADADTVRRAYLRGLKTRKPEVDPEGFKRLREAFELISAGVGEDEEEPQVGAAAQDPPAPTDASQTEARDAQEEDDEDAPAAEVDLAEAYHRALVDLSPAPPPRLAVDQIFALLAERRPNAARRLASAFGTWVTATGEVTALGGVLGIRWRMARDLADLERYAPKKLIAAIAKGEREGNAMLGADEARRYRTARPDEARTLGRYMLRSTPLLAAYADALVPPRRRPVAPARGGEVPKWTFGGGAGIAGVILWGLFSSAARTTMLPPEPPRWSADRIEAAVAAWPVEKRPAARRMHAHAELFRAAVRLGHGPDETASAEQLSVVLERATCPSRDVRIALQNARARFSFLPTAVRVVDDLDADWLMVCPEERPESRPAQP